MKINLVRWVLTLVLIGGVYTETGIWTALYCFLASLSFEVMNYEK